MLVRQFLARRGQAQLLWAISMAMFAVASAAVTIGVASGWTKSLFAVYWAFGAVLNVPFLAGGELVLLFRQAAGCAGPRGSCSSSAWRSRSRCCARPRSTRSRCAEQPALGQGGVGRRDGRAPTAAAVLLSGVLHPGGGALWSAWRMRGRPELQDRFVGTLLIVIGATIVAGGSAFAAFGQVTGFIADARDRDRRDVLGVPACLEAGGRAGCRRRGGRRVGLARGRPGRGLSGRRPAPSRPARR